MLKGPYSEKRPVGVIGNAVQVMRIVTGEIEEDTGEDDGEDPAAKALGGRGRKARAARMSPEQCANIAERPLLNAG